MECDDSLRFNYSPWRRSATGGMLGFLLLLSARSVAQDYTYVPDAPSTTYSYADSQETQEQRDFRTYLEKKEAKPKPVGFFAFRKSWQDPPLRTNRQFFHSKLIWIADGIAFTSTIVACSRRNSQESWGSEIPAIVGIAGLGYVGDRFFTRSFAIGPMIYATAHYIHSATK